MTITLGFEIYGAGVIVTEIVGHSINEYQCRLRNITREADDNFLLNMAAFFWPAMPPILCIDYFHTKVWPHIKAGCLLLAGGPGILLANRLIRKKLERKQQQEKLAVEQAEHKRVLSMSIEKLVAEIEASRKDS